MTTTPTLIAVALHCHTECSAIVCPACRYSAGEAHYRDDADPESGELSAWSTVTRYAGDLCPNCAGEGYDISDLYVPATGRPQRVRTT